ncbi:MAG TPA: hypothetical protein VE864_12475, partial [Streptosporangiaceae bacterium]|nr:hypothetical protein [Streptosporangiaceae bacterium]
RAAARRAGSIAAGSTARAVNVAQHLSALTFGQVNNASMMGTVQLSDAEADRIITTGIAAFMRAYAPPAR